MEVGGSWLTLLMTSLEFIGCAGGAPLSAAAGVTYLFRLRSALASSDPSSEECWIRPFSIVVVLPTVGTPGKPSSFGDCTWKRESTYLVSSRFSSRLTMSAAAELKKLPMPHSEATPSAMNGAWTTLGTVAPLNRNPCTKMDTASQQVIVFDQEHMRKSNGRLAEPSGVRPPHA